MKYEEVQEIKNEGKQELAKEIEDGKVKDFKVNTTKFFLKSKIFWINAITVVAAIIPDLLSFLMTNIEFVTVLKEYNTSIYMVLFAVNASLNIYFRTKNQDVIVVKKKRKIKEKINGDD